MTGANEESFDRDAVTEAKAALARAAARSTEVDLSAIDPPLRADRWTLSEPALRLLVALVTDLRPRHILEFGSGLSTRLLWWASQQAGDACRISSIDHDPYFARASRLALRGQNRTERVCVVDAPLVVRACGADLYPMYSFESSQLASDRPADLILADGPPALLGGRSGTLFQAMDHARAGTVFLLDDADRAAEQAAMRLWRDELDEAIESVSLDGLDGRLAAFVIRRPVPSSSLAHYRLALAMSELRRQSPSARPVILVDDNQWAGVAEIEALRPIPFLERDGQYWGAPADDAEAIAGLERLRGAGAGCIAFAWPAHWWLDHYRGFAERLDTRYRCVLRNRRLIIYDLRTEIV